MTLVFTRRHTRVTVTRVFPCCHHSLNSNIWIPRSANISSLINLPRLISLVLSLATTGSSSRAYQTSQAPLLTSQWGYRTGWTSIIMSLAVNVIVTCLIAFKIFKVYCKVKPLYNTGVSKLRPIIFVIIESGLVLFSIQLAYLVVILLEFEIGICVTSSIQRMLTVIISSVIVTCNFTDKVMVVRE